MIRTALALGHNDCRLFLKDASGYVWLFAVPFLFVFFFGASGEEPDAPADPKPAMLIENLDQGFMGELLVRELTRQGLRPIDPDDDIADQVKRGLRIPHDATEAIADRRAVNLEFFTREGGSLGADAMVETRLQRGILALLAHLVELGDQTQFNREALEALIEAEDPLKITTSFAGTQIIPRGYAQSLPGMATMFLMMNLLLFGGISISEERNNGVLKRLMTQPLGRTGLIFGKIYGRFLLALFQIFVYLVAGAFFIPFQGDLPALLIALVLYAWCCAALGVMIGGLVSQPDKVVAIAVLGANIMAALSGCWWPQELSPEMMRQIARIFPTAWAMSAFQGVITYGDSITGIALELGVLAAFAIAATALAARYLRT